MTDLLHPLHSLNNGHWFKLICGASFQHLPAVRNLTLVYTLAGADCIDIAADPVVIAAAQEGIRAASLLGKEAKQRGFGFQSLPWLMVSFNDGEDAHFRKAEFNPALCPADCARPCQKICPADAIAFSDDQTGFSGVIDQRCYGCGRCLTLCPIQQIYTRSYVTTPPAIAPLILGNNIQAIEIHTQVGHLTDFQRLWEAIAPWSHQLKLISISFPDHENLIDYLWSILATISPLPCPLIWQTDGRPMSGDIGDGTTHAAVKLAEKVLAAKLPGYIQLAGGTNSHTVDKLKQISLIKDRGIIQPTPSIAGIAYGSYARVLLSPMLEQLDTIYIDQNQLKHTSTITNLESMPDLLWPAVHIAHTLVRQLKSSTSLPVKEVITAISN